MAASGWRASATRAALPADPAQWPEVVAVVPARDEAEVIARSIGSLLAQDYPGSFRIVLVDDSSSDGTARHRACACTGAHPLEILTGRSRSRPAGPASSGRWRRASQRAGDAPTICG